MRTEQLQYFLKIAQTGSIRVAAAELFISQPALTSSIKQLEKELGYALFERNYNGVVLTADGRRALPIINSALNSLMTLPRKTDIPEIKNTHTPLKILTVYSQNFAAIPALLNYFQFHWPALSFNIFEKSCSEILNGIINDDYDLGLIALHERQLSELKLPENMVIEQFDIEPAYVRVQRTSILASEKAVTLEQLSTFPLVFPNSSLNDDFTISKFFNDTPPKNIVLQTNNNALLESYCLANDCALPCYLFIQKPEDTLNSQYKFIPIADVFTSFYGLYYENNSNILIIKDFLNALKNYYDYPAKITQ